MAAAVLASPMFVTPPSNDEDRLDMHHNDTPASYLTVDDVIGETEPTPDLATRVCNTELHLACTREPSTFQEAAKDEAWKAAMRAEMNVVEEIGT